MTPNAPPGNNGRCCGDDEINDNFYNGTIGTTNWFCKDGEYIKNSLDEMHRK
jgi:hypothetical protein